MTETDTDKFVDLWTCMAELYGRKLSRNAINLAYAILRHYTMEEVIIAVTEAMVTTKGAKFMPTPGMLVDQIRAMRKRGRSTQVVDEAPMSDRELWILQMKKLNPDFDPDDKKTQKGVPAIGQIVPKKVKAKRKKAK